MPYWHDCCPLKAASSKRYKHASTAAAHIAKSLFSAVCVFANSQQSNVDPLVQLCFLSQIIRYYFYLGLNLKKKDLAEFRHPSYQVKLNLRLFK